MPPKTMYEAYDDEFSWSQFRAWAEATYGNNYDAEYTLFDLVDHNFKTNPIMTEANMIFMQVIGAPHLEWDSMQYLSCELPLELRLRTMYNCRTNVPVDAEWAAIGGDIAVPEDAFDEVVRYVVEQTQPVWDYFVSLDTDPNADPTSAGETVDWDAAYATNHANTGAVDDGDELAWAQYGTALLIGDGHAAAAVQYLNAHPETERGTLRVERGSVQYPRGRLRVVGCSQQDDFKTAVRAGGSQKHISFRDE